MNSLCNCLSLRQATRRVTQLYDQALAPVGLRVTQFSLLLQAEALGPIALQPLAEVMVMDRATLGHNVRPLLARGLVQLEVGSDRRSRELSITQVGRDLLVEARAVAPGTGCIRSRDGPGYRVRPQRTSPSGSLYGVRASRPRTVVSLSLTKRNGFQQKPLRDQHRTRGSHSSPRGRATAPGLPRAQRH